ncbi:MAG: thrombospondin type 3 repeat-containing protein, partial [Byssovorax sp.]
CNAGQCDACSSAAGALLDGTCALLTGAVCNDGDACTQTDTCQAGTCTGANPLTCAAATSCEIDGACDPMSGLCNKTAKPDDTPCPGGVCKAGVCFGDLDGDKVADSGDNCPTVFNPDQDNHDTDALGDVCDDDLDGDTKPNAADNCPTFPNQMQEDANQDGVGDACDCASPKKDGDPCDDADLCTPKDTCAAGKCQPGVHVSCPALALCQDTLCLPTTGGCLVFNGVDGAPCPSGVCIAGGCFVELPFQASTSSSGSGGSSAVTGSGGMMGTSTGASTSASSGMGTGGSADAGAGGSAGEITLQGGACGVPAGAPSPRAAWLGVMALLALARRRGRISRPHARR